MPPKVFTAQGKRDIKAENIQKKGDDGPPLMPSKRMNPMKEERAGVQKPPSRVLTNTAPTPPIPPPLIRSKLQADLRQPVSRLAYGLAIDKNPANTDASSSATSIAALPPAPELDTQWVQLRRLQGRYIKGPHGDLLSAEGIGSGVTEPFFFSAVRPGSSANKRASGWFGSTVNPLLNTTSVVDFGDTSAGAGASSRRKSVGDTAAMGGSTRLDPNATSASALASSKKNKKLKNPNPTNLKEYIAFLFGANRPQSIYDGTPSIVREFHAQCFPFVRADGLVEIATVARQVFAPMSPTTPDIVEIATHWLELEADKDRNAAQNEAAQREKEFHEQMMASAENAENGEFGENNNNRNNRAPSAQSGTIDSTVSFPQAQNFGDKNTTIAPEGFIQYSSLLVSVGAMLTNEHDIDLAYDLCDVCSNGIINKAAVKRFIAAKQTNGASEDEYVVFGSEKQRKLEEQSANEVYYFSPSIAAFDADKPALQQQQQQMRTPARNQQQQQQHPPSATRSISPTGTTSTQTGISSSVLVSNLRNATNNNNNQNKMNATNTGLTTTTSSNSMSVANNNNSNAVKNTYPAATIPTNFRSLGQLFQDLQNERQVYIATREAQHPPRSVETLVGDIIRTTTLGHFGPTHRARSAPGRFWVTSNPKFVEKLVPSDHFQFNVSSAVMRAFSHISNFEQHRAFFPKAKIGKKPKKNATMPSMRQEHITRREFGDIFVSDPHVATPFLPFLIRCALTELNPPPPLPSNNNQSNQQQNPGIASPMSQNSLSLATSHYPSHSYNNNNNVSTTSNNNNNNNNQTIGRTGSIFNAGASTASGNSN